MAAVDGWQGNAEQTRGSQAIAKPRARQPARYMAAIRHTSIHQIGRYVAAPVLSRVHQGLSAGTRNVSVDVVFTTVRRLPVLSRPSTLLTGPSTAQ